MITIHTLTHVRSFLRAAARSGLFTWMLLLSVSTMAQVAGPAIAAPPSEPSPGALTNLVSQIAGLQSGVRPVPPARQMRASQRWEWEQRAYPLGYIPEGAFPRAREQTRAADRINRPSPKLLGVGQAGGHFSPVGPAPIDNGQTTPTGPVSGRITDIAVAPDDPNHWLMGAAQGGVWETFNAGANWLPLTDWEASLAIGAVAFAPSNSKIIYVGTGEANSSDSHTGAGLLKSVDGGATWTLLAAATFAERGFSAILVDPSNPNILVAATSGHNGTGRGGGGPPLAPPTGVFTSQDGGTNWTQRMTGDANDLQSAPGSFSWQYSSFQKSSVWRSSNGGQGWTAVNGPWTNFQANIGRIALAFAPADPNVVYVSIEDVLTTNAIESLGIWRTINALGATPAWSKIPAPPETEFLFYAHKLAVDPLDSRILYFGQVELLKFDGTGSGGVASGTWTNIQRNLHSDIHALAWAGTDRLICGNDGGVYYTDNRGATDWINCNSTLAITAFYSGSTHRTLSSLALGGAQDNGSSRWNGRYDWRRIGDGDGADNLIGDNTNHQAVSSQNLGITRTVNGDSVITNWIDVTSDITDLTNAPFIARMRRHPSNENLVIAGTDKIWRTANFFSSAPGLPSWSPNSPDLGPGAVYITALAFAPSDTTGQAYAYGTGKGQLAITYDGGAHWLDLDRNNLVPNRYVTQIAFDPQSSARLYVTLSGYDEGTPGQPGHVFYTDYAYAEQQGNPVTWKDVSPPVDLPQNALAVDPVDPKVIYVGADLGVWRCRDAHTGGSNNWDHLGPANGLPNVAVFYLQFHGLARRLFAFTHGRGLFIADLIPGNDDVANAQLLEGAAGSLADTTVSATHEAGEPAQAGGSGTHSVWFQWTPSYGGVATIDTAGSAFNTVLAVYGPGSSCNGLALPALASDNGSAGAGASRVTIQAIRNNTYYIAVDGADPSAFGTFNLNYSTVVDTTPPVVTFSPLTDQQVVFNFSQLGGTVSEPSTVQFKIEEFRAGGNQFWNGVNWTSVANDPGVLLPANLSVLNWTPASGTLPPRLQLAQADYVIHVYATDTAGNGGSNDLVLARSAPDTTPPIVNLDSTSIHPGDVITNHVLPLVSGLAYDPESGVSAVNVLLARSTGSGFLYWDGANWTATPTNLTATYLAQNISWQLNVALPSGANLPNATYSLDISAMNNEVPAGSGSLNLNFSVDYHPVYLWTAGSFSDLDPNNNNNNLDNPANWDVGTMPPTNAVAVIND